MTAAERKQTSCATPARAWNAWFDVRIDDFVS
jgi:hypothetical protein